VEKYSSARFGTHLAEVIRTALRHDPR